MKFDSAFTHSLSLDGTGRTWTRPVTIKKGSATEQGIGCCRPRVLQLAAGPVLLTGGRCTPIGPAENHMWVNQKGDLVDWEKISLSSHHNALAPADMPKYSVDVNCTAKNGTRMEKCSDRETLGYTSLLPTGNSSGVVVYNLNSRKCPCAYSMRFSVQADVAMVPGVAAVDVAQ